MNIFQQWAQNYWDHGLQPVPIEPNSKICRVKNSNKHFFDEFLSQDELDKWVDSHGAWDIGVAMGRVSGVVAVDFDYEEPEDLKNIEAMIIGALPITPCIKVGQKGWTRFYRYIDGIGTKHLKRKTNEKHLLDILSTGSVTVMPPSIHNKTKKPYYWASPESLFDVEIDELPILTAEHIKELEKISEFEPMKINEFDLNKSGRHDRIFSFVMRDSNHAKDIDQLVKRVLQFDEMINANNEKGPYFKDKRYLLGNPPEVACKRLVLRMTEWKKSKQREKGIDWDIGRETLSYWIQTEKGARRSDKYEDFAEFFSIKIPETRVDIFTRFAYTKVRGRWEPTENLVEVLQSFAIGVGLQKAQVGPHLQRWIKSLKPKMLIDIPVYRQWGEVDKMINALTFKNIKKEYAVELFKEWLAGVFIRIKEPWIQNHFVILKGKQGVGKDTWIQHLLSGLGPYFGEMVVSHDKRENYMTLTGLAVGFIPEFDETNKASIGVLKSMVTVKDAVLRMPYSRRADRFDFRHSLISSSNFENLLRDSSGNRRYMIFDVDEVDFQYRKDLDPIRLISEAAYLAKTGFKASKEAREAMNELITDKTPDNIDELIEIDCRYKIQGVTTLLKPWVEWQDISDDILNISKKYGVSLRRVQSIMKDAGIQKRDPNGRFYTHLKTDKTSRQELKL